MKESRIGGRSKRMIWGIIAIITGLVLRSKAIVLIPLVYLLARKNKDLGLIAYFFYGVALIGDVFVKDILSFEALKALLLGALSGADGF
ncbi:hypothetical protein E3E22_04420 [Thermococcus sp. MV5]|uniref:hypothetical protein n=1 Tax=Thermococcus sp. MV5 TaxID=1638272 RepID=UPI00143C245A|nr:hypothetical protein [Thermococcus sp. MV5]NJE25876.1 hypothetical protein [Thermococcus sp. MV5]